MSEAFGWAGVVLGVVLLALLVREGAGQAASEPAAETALPGSRRRHHVGVLALLVVVVTLTLGPRLVSLLM